MKKLVLLGSLLALFISCTSDPEVGEDSLITNAGVEQKIDSLIALMTLDEKVGQMNQYNGNWDVTGPVPEGDYLRGRYDAVANGSVGSMLNVVGAEATLEAQKLAVENSRLGIPLLFAYDVIHGYQTIFPIPLGDASSWDLEAVKSAARVAAIESSAAGLHWTFAPMMDVTRDPRWGRIMEGAGEDPYLVSEISAARIRGFQGDDLADLTTIAATAKHFAGYGFIRAGRDYNTTELSNKTLYNMVLPPFKAAVDAGVATVMNSFNDIDGVPITGNSRMQRAILKEDWGFEGLIVSDWGTVAEMVAHDFARDLEDAAMKAAIAGTDVDMEARGYELHLADLVRAGKVDEQVLDEAVRRILRIKYAIGLFDDPYRYSDPEREKNNIYTEEHRAIARDVAKRSVVLLKNEGNILPLSKSTRTIAVIGALANDKDTPLGSWRAHAIPNSAVSLLEGVQAAVSNNTRVPYAKGYTLATGERSFLHELDFSNVNDRSEISTAIRTARNADAVIVAVGEEAFQSGEGRSQADISLKGVQLELLKELKKVNDNIVVVLMNGRPIAEPWMYDNMPAILETWHLGTEAGNAIADVIFGDYNPSGKLPVTIPRSVGQIPIFYNHDRTGRPDDAGDIVFWSHYTDEENTPQYSFGHGLSYTTFSYSDFRLSSDTKTLGEEVTATVTVTNTGEMDGEEVIQLYIHDEYASMIQPVKELKGFRKVMIPAGESVQVSFTITDEMLGFYNLNREFVTEPGDFEIMAGGNSTDLLVRNLKLIE